MNTPALNSTSSDLSKKPTSINAVPVEGSNNYPAVAPVSNVVPDQQSTKAGSSIPPASGPVQGSDSNTLNVEAPVTGGNGGSSSVPSLSAVSAKQSDSPPSDKTKDSSPSKGDTVPSVYPDATANSSTSASASLSANTAGQSSQSGSQSASTKSSADYSQTQSADEDDFDTEDDEEYADSVEHPNYPSFQNTTTVETRYLNENNSSSNLLAPSSANSNTSAGALASSSTNSNMSTDAAASSGATTSQSPAVSLDSVKSSSQNVTDGSLLNSNQTCPAGTISPAVESQNKLTDINEEIVKIEQQLRQHKIKYQKVKDQLAHVSTLLRSFFMYPSDF